MVRKRTYRRRKTNVSSMVKKAVLAHAKKTVEVKHKYLTSASAINATGYGFQVHDWIDAGTGVADRIGSRINMISLAMTSRMSTDSTNGGSLRVLVVETRRPLAWLVLNSRYDIRPLFDNSAGTVGQVAASLDFDWVKRVHHDRRYTFNQMVSGATLTKFIKFYIKFGASGKRIVYDQDTLAPAINDTKTYVYVCFCIDSGMNSNVTPNTYLKMRFTDE